MLLGHIRHNVATIERQQIMAVSELALGDPSVIIMWFGECDLVTDPAIMAPAIQSLQAGETFYTVERCLPGLPKVSGYRPPTASFYGFFKIDGTAGRRMEACQWLVREAKVGIALGTAFGPGEGLVRLCFALRPDRLSQAFDRLKGGLSRL